MSCRHLPPPWASSLQNPTRLQPGREALHFPTRMHGRSAADRTQEVSSKERSPFIASEGRHAELLAKKRSSAPWFEFQNSSIALPRPSHAGRLGRLGPPHFFSFFFFFFFFVGSLKQRKRTKIDVMIHSSHNECL